MAAGSRHFLRDTLPAGRFEPFAEALLPTLGCSSGRICLSRLVYTSGVAAPQNGSIPFIVGSGGRNNSPLARGRIH